MPFVEADGIRLAYDIHGDPDGEPVLLIAGLGLQLISWPEGFCRGLTDQGLRIIRFDNRDSGLSSMMDQFGKPSLPMVWSAFLGSWLKLPIFRGYTLHDMARDAVNLLDALHVKRAHMVGVSMGGIIAQIIAARYPDRVLTLTSIMSTSGRHGLPGPTLAAANALFSRPYSPNDINSVVDHYVKLFKVIGSPGYPTPDHILRRRFLEAARRNPSFRGTMRQILAVAASGDRSAELRTIRVPTLVLHGKDDPLVPVACGRDTARQIANAFFHEIEGMGHDLPAELDEMITGLIGLHCKGELPTPARARAS